jgi:hypothetical protein
MAQTLAGSETARTAMMKKTCLQFITASFARYAEPES